ncbi:hypothetical protein SAMN06265370_10918 [Puniceibacterium sediminis]|uniref:Uncharacterized protein n=1 Tax=Puniceibacterium sediminis TaxID=1608407 RepID=A0A238X322_9RHOB|nr:hypothetical protein SAMN06265370_10918 [Puniceibacterium sediminis]
MMPGKINESKPLIPNPRNAKKSSKLKLNSTTLLSF